MLFFLTESQDDTDTPMEAQNMNDSGVDETIVDTTRPSQRQVPTVSRTPDLQQFRSEASRLETFRSWTHRYPMPADLANAGFIFTGKLITCLRNRYLSRFFVQVGYVTTCPCASSGNCYVTIRPIKIIKRADKNWARFYEKSILNTIIFRKIPLYFNTEK